MPDVMKALSRLYADVFPFHPNWKFGAGHVVYWIQATSLDHVVHLARGGLDIESNMATACYLCNDTKRAWTNEDIGYVLGSVAGEIGWDGLTSFLPALKARIRGLKSAASAHVPAPARDERAPLSSVQKLEPNSGSSGFVGALVRVARPGHKQRRQYRVVSDGPSGCVLREMWRSAGRWVGSENGVVVPRAFMSGAEVVAIRAPLPGDPG
jgi:hypothetical protein